MRNRLPVVIPAILIVLCLFVALAQNKAVVTPVIYRLPPDASLEYQALENKKAAIVKEANRQIEDVEKDQKLIMALNGVPKAELDRKATPEGDHYVFYPKSKPSSTP